MGALRVTHVGNGVVYLIAGGGKIYTDIAARFCRSERTVKEIIDSPYSPEIVRNILSSSHKAALEFDYFLFGVEGYSRITETQLVRKRMASYLIKSGRADLGDKRLFSVVLPDDVANFEAEVDIPGGWFSKKLSGTDILHIVRQWYDQAIKAGMHDEDARYLKPQATEFRGIIGMNARSLLEFFAVRCCKNAQEEIRDMATKMLHLCKNVAPDLFADAGPNCVQLGYCPENSRQHYSCTGKIITKDDALRLIKNNKDCNRLLSS